ncbi:MAG: multicopper oxidase family protein [Bacteroidetes Order II. Incertae sedis bacterium]|jgi:suppressor of ftsI|nr:multicopper oxidase family protein [Bacteroidetes Order II. bacterium]MBT4051879.1 multicopper oxidase family protein [Bacteroidetes Order II. bacterium]MBT4602054.1 multicopper oxidase family protein [Bacteroidetes Order II. bacterium]MBT5251051.1 multicopper oxidase family protein [Bacteroidetes Order II. bacterium]MBT6200158.1 multicopper oxidase family protein [Bacteroidetes Order II. bacterium]
MRTTSSDFLRVVFLIISFIALDVAGTCIPAYGQHEGHEMNAEVQARLASGEAIWRMPPMDMSMPMLAGLSTALPPIAPFLPGLGLDPMDVPLAEVPRFIELEDGDQIVLEATFVRRSLNGHVFIGYGINGQFPGPVLRAKEGSTVSVRFVNHIEMPSTIRWHGLRVDNAYDGTPVITQDPVQVGGEFVYELRFSDPGVFWYHAGVRLDFQVDSGMYGGIIVEPKDTDHYSASDREEVIILDDVLMDDAGILPFGRDVPNHTLMGRFGNTFLINGSDRFHLMASKGERVRLHIINAANTRTYNLTFDGIPLRIVASDLSRYEKEVPANSVVIAPGERYVVELELENEGMFNIKNSIQAIDHFRGVFNFIETEIGMIHVGAETINDVVSKEEARTNQSVSEGIDPYRSFFEKEPDKKIELTLKVQDLPLPLMMMMETDTLYVPPVEWNDTMPMMNWLSTGSQVFWVMRDLDTGLENMEIYWGFDEGDVVKIRIFNDPRSLHPMNHPLHLHGQRFLVLDVDGKRNENLVWKDTAIIPVASTVDILVDMSNPGEWVMHCHIAEHLHAGMMLSFGVWNE